MLGLVMLFNISSMSPFLRSIYRPCLVEISNQTALILYGAKKENEKGNINERAVHFKDAENGEEVL